MDADADRGVRNSQLRTTVKLLLVSQYYEPAWDYGGPAAKVTAISRHLSERGHEVDVLTSCVATAQRNGIGRPGTSTTGGLTVHYLPAILRYRGVTINPGVSSFCREYLDRFDLVHIFGVYDWLGTMTFRAVRARRKPYVVEPLGMYRPMERGFGRKWVYRSFVGGDLLAGARRIIATSQTEFDQLQSMGIGGDGRLIIRRNGVDADTLVAPSFLTAEALAKAVSLAKQRLSVPERDRILLFLGRLAPIKNLELLIDAFAGLDLPDVHLVIAGPRPDPGYARQLEQRAATDTRIHFHGAVHGAEKALLLSAAHLVVLSSRSESYGNVIAEAISAGVPVVVTDGCGIAPLVRDRVGLVAEQRADAFRAALRRLLETPALYDRFKAACGAVKREVSWDEPIAMLERTYAEVLKTT